MNRWLSAVRNAASVKEWWKSLASKMRGHYAYYGVTDNSRSIAKYYLEVIILVHKWLNRRSQRKSMNWDGYQKYLEKFRCLSQESYTVFPYQDNFVRQPIEEPYESKGSRPVL